MATISKTFMFHAAHRLPNDPGQCRNLHGHTYTTDIEVTRDDGRPYDRSEGTAEQGMVANFDVLKNIWTLIDFDHRTLLWVQDPLYRLLQVVSDQSGPIVAFDFPPTAEIIASRIFSSFRANLPDRLRLVSVTVHETPTSWARVAR